jgi:hypothetical protein
MKKLIIILAAIALVATFAATTMAAEWSFYGSARMGTWWTDVDKEVPDKSFVNKFAPTGSSSQMAVSSESDDFDDSGLAWILHGNSRIGANVKFNDSVSGRFEYGTGVNTRLLYGVWDFGSGKLLVGQNYTPITHLNSNQAYNEDEGMLGMEPYASRRPMIQLSFGGFKIAFIQPTVSSDTFSKDTAIDIFYDGDAAAAAADPDFVSYSDTIPTTDTDTTLPKIEINYQMKFDQVTADVYGGYQTFDRVDSLDREQSVDSYIFGAQAKFNFGPAWVLGNLWFAQNLREYGVLFSSPFPVIWSPGAAGSYEDSDSWGGELIANYKASDMFALEAGLGYHNTELSVLNVDFEQATLQYYVQCAITLAPNVYLVPEIGIYDYDSLDVGPYSEDLGKIMYAGLKWQINF